MHAAMPVDQRGPLTRLDSADGNVQIYEHAEFRMGNVGKMPLFVDVYALPGSPNAELARRIRLSECDGYLFTTDKRARTLANCKTTFRELREYMAERGRTIEDASVLALLTRKPGSARESDSNRVEAYLSKHLGEERLMSLTLDSGEKAIEAIKKCTAQVLSKERDALEARRSGAPPPRLTLPEDLAEDVELGHHLYLRLSAVHGRDFSPHADRFLAQVFEHLDGATPEHLEEALRLKAQAKQLDLEVSLPDILLKRQMIEPEVVTRGRRVRACVEVIHEEVVWGRIASELGVVPFDRIKRALLLQSKRGFQYTLEHLLQRAGQLDTIGRRRILAEQEKVHQGELMRDQQAAIDGANAGSQIFDTRSGGRTERKMPLFGEVAVNLGLVTAEQFNECISEQRKLREKGTKRFLGAVMRRKGYLSEEEIPLVCSALEAEIRGDRIDGYKIHKSLGRGNMALVFSATQMNLDRVIALKILDPKLLFGLDFIDRFLEEARAAARLNHAHIVQAYDVGSSEDLHYFAMEFVDGVTLRDMIDVKGLVDEQTAIDITIQVARALGHAAKHQLVHRDVKPSNIMITRDGVAKLCDLGLAKRIDQATGDEGMILGSPYYISPEQIEGRSDIDTRADIYSLGATLFHVLTNRPPFKGRTPEDVCLKHLSEPMPDPSTLSGSVTQRITPVVFKMMAKDRRYRYKDCGEVVRDLLLLRPDGASDERQADLARRLNQAFPPPTRRWRS
jgi:eukaryotic-like serine/threonine-protein kinase